EAADAVLGGQRNRRNPVRDLDTVGARLRRQAEQLPEREERQPEREEHRRAGQHAGGTPRKRPDADEAVDGCADAGQQRDEPDVLHLESTIYEVRSTKYDLRSTNYKVVRVRTATSASSSSRRC